MSENFELNEEIGGFDDMNFPYLLEKNEEFKKESITEEKKNIENIKIENKDLSAYKVNYVIGYRKCIPCILFVSIDKKEKESLEESETIGVPGFLDETDKRFYVVDSPWKEFKELDNFEEGLKTFLEGEVEWDYLKQ